jgi:hypothetical protein
MTRHGRWVVRRVFSRAELSQRKLAKETGQLGEPLIQTAARDNDPVGSGLGLHHLHSSEDRVRTVAGRPMQRVLDRILACVERRLPLCP